MEALRTVISLAVTSVGDYVPNSNIKSEQPTQISFVDVKRAYFSAEVDKNDALFFGNLPAEDPGSVTMCARVLRHMYGTRMAAD